MGILSNRGDLDTFLVRNRVVNVQKVLRNGGAGQIPLMYKDLETTPRPYITR